MSDATSPMRISELRQRIDEIDSEILRLLNRRAAAGAGRRPSENGTQPRVPRPAARGGDLRPPRRRESRAVPRAGGAAGVPRGDLRVSVAGAPAARGLPRPAGDLLAPGRHGTVRPLGAVPGHAQHRRGVRGGGEGERGLRGRAGGEFHRGGGEPHPGHVRGLAAADLRRGGRRGGAASAEQGRPAWATCERSTPTRTAWPNPASGWSETRPTSRWWKPAARARRRRSPPRSRARPPSPRSLPPRCTISRSSSGGSRIIPTTSPGS